MDYRQFLQKPEERVLPYFGGTRVEDKDRHFRVVGEWRPGWWRFAIKKREARPAAPAEPQPIDHLPAVRGHYAGGWLFSSGQKMHRIALPPSDEPEPFAPCIGRRWYGGEILMDSVEFEDDAEIAVRDAFENQQSISQTKGVSPGLRAAFGYAVATSAAAELGIRLSAREISGRVLVIADGGPAIAAELLAEIEAQREAQRIATEARLRERALQDAARHAVVATNNRANPARRADQALEAAGARMLRSRPRSGLLEVVFNFMGERFISLVDPGTLRVVDSGICLSGADRQLNLKSLPSAIKEAIDTGALHITRH